MSNQPEAILSDSKKALKMWRDPKRDPDRFGDDIDNIQFWVNMTKIMRAELIKAIKINNSSVEEETFARAMLKSANPRNPTSWDSLNGQQKKYWIQRAKRIFKILSENN